MRVFRCALLIALMAGLTGAADPQVPGDRLVVTTEPNSTVWVDDIRYGKTDSIGKLVITGLDGSRHRLKVRADGFREAVRTIASPNVELTLTLTKTTDPAELAFQEAERLLSRDREQAASAYRKAIRLRTRYPDAYIGLARVLSDSGDLEGALKAIRDMRRVTPVNAEATAIEGRIYKELGDEPKAIAAFKRSIMQARGFQPEAYTGLGLLFKEKAEAAGAGGDLAAEDANYIEASKNLTIALKQLGSAPDAIVLYQLLGLVYEKQRKYDDAIRVYNEFLRRFPDSNDAPAVQSFIEQIRKVRP